MRAGRQRKRDVGEEGLWVNSSILGRKMLITTLGRVPMPVPLWQPDIARKKKSPKRNLHRLHAHISRVHLYPILFEQTPQKTNSTLLRKPEWRLAPRVRAVPHAVRSHWAFTHIYCAHVLMLSTAFWFCWVLSNRELTSDGVLHKSVAKTEVWIKGNKRQTNQRDTQRYVHRCRFHCYSCHTQAHIWSWSRDGVCMWQQPRQTSDGSYFMMRNSAISSFLISDK